MLKNGKRVIALICALCMVVTMDRGLAGRGVVYAEETAAEEETFTASYIDKDGKSTDLSADLDRNFSAYKTENKVMAAMMGSTVDSVWNQSAKTSAADDGFKNNFLAPKHRDERSQKTFLVYEGKTPEKCKIRVEMLYHTVRYGIAIIDKSAITNGRIDLDTEETYIGLTIGENGGKNNILRIRRGEDISNGFPDLTDFPDSKVDVTTANRTYVLNAEVKDGKIKAYVDGCETVTEANLPAGYNMEDKVIALYAVGCNQGGFKSLTIEDIHKAFTASYVDKYGKSTDLSADLDGNFKAYKTEKKVINTVLGNTVDSVWNQSAKTSVADAGFKNDFLAPRHIDKDDQRTLLVYQGNTPEKCKIRVEMLYHNPMYGIAIIDKETFSSGTIDFDKEITIRQSIGENGKDNILRIRGMGLSNGFPGLTDFPEPRVDATTANRTYVLNVEVGDGKIKAYVDGCKTVTEVTLPEGYDIGEKVIALCSGGCNQGGFKSLTIEDMHKAFTASYVDKYGKSADLSADLDGNFKAYKTENKVINATLGNTVDSVWNQSAKTSVANAGFKNDFLAPQHRNESVQKAFLVYGGEIPEKCKIRVEMLYHGVEYGIAIIDKSAIANGKIDLGVETTIRQSINESGNNWLRIRGTNISNGFVNLSDFPEPRVDATTANHTYVLNVEVADGQIKAYVDGCETVTDAKLPAEYNMNDKVIALYSVGCEQGGFKSLTITELESYNLNDKTLLTLKNNFVSYQFDNADSTVSKSEDPDEYWNANAESQNGGYERKGWLIPNHRGSENKTSTLTLKNKTLRNFEASYTYSVNWLEYGIMVAPEGKQVVDKNYGSGLSVYVNSDGKIILKGAYDKNSVKNVGFTDKLPEFVGGPDKAKDKTYTVHVSVIDKVVKVWLDEYPDCYVTANLTAGYQGGALSLYATGCDHGSFTNLAIKEYMEDPAAEDAKLTCRKENVGDYTIVTLYTDGVTDVMYHNALKYDTEKYTYMEMRLIDPDSAYSDPVGAVKDGRVEFSMISRKEKKQAVIIFKNNTNTAEKVPFTMTGEMYGIGGIAMNVTWKSAFYGDVTSDDKVDVLDLIRLRKYAAGAEGAVINRANSELDDTGVCGSDANLTLMRKSLVGIGSIQIP